MRVLILGGTTEASDLAKLLAGDSRFDAILSLAGRTSNPRPQPVTTRVGGFGGADGLAAFVSEQKIEAVVDATHPYAARISANAVVGCRQAGVALASLVRPPWTMERGDNWKTVPTTTTAALALGAEPQRVFLSLGRQDLHVFAAFPRHHYIARMIERPQQTVLPHNLVLLQQRGPFDFEAERELLKTHKIGVIVSKNSGGSATYPKIEAARVLGLPVIMIGRPAKPAGHVVKSVDAALAWLAQGSPPVSRRGV